jgi:hypothetical protein
VYRETTTPLETIVAIRLPFPLPNPKSVGAELESSEGVEFKIFMALFSSLPL